MSGQITSVVRDTNTGNAIQGALVRTYTQSTLLDTQTTDVTGNFTTGILNQGFYNIVVSKDGYNQLRFQNIRVSSDVTLSAMFLQPTTTNNNLYGQKSDGTWQPISADNYGNIQSAVNFIYPQAGSMFDRLQTAEYTPIFNITPVYGISYLRDIITTTGSGNVSNTGAGYTLTITTGTSDTATLATAERGRFTVGSAFEAGIVMSIPVPPVATQKATWGVADNNNGLYFGQDSTGIFIASLRNGTETKVYQSNWNVDKLNGTGPSGFTLNTSTGYMYQIRFSYNQGVAEFRVVFINPVTFEQEVVVCHRLFSASGTIVADPDLPIQAYIANGITTPSQSFAMYVRGRFFSNLGTFQTMNRLTSERRLSMVTNNTTFVPTVSFQRQAIFPSGSGRNNSINVSIDSFDIITSDDAVWQLRFNSTLTGASFGSPSDTPSTETCVLTDVSATAINISTGIKLMGGIASAGQKTGLSTFPVDIVLPSTQIATLCVRNISSNSGTVSVVLRVHEEW